MMTKKEVEKLIKICGIILSEGLSETVTIYDYRTVLVQLLELMEECDRERTFQILKERTI